MYVLLLVTNWLLPPVFLTSSIATSFASWPMWLHVNPCFVSVFCGFMFVYECECHAAKGPTQKHMEHVTVVSWYTWPRRAASQNDWNTSFSRFFVVFPVCLTVEFLILTLKFAVRCHLAPLNSCIKFSCFICTKTINKEMSPPQWQIKEKN